MSLSKFLDPKNDISFKRIFGTEKNKDILIHFINDILGLKENNKIEDVSFLSPVQDPEIASKKQSIVDVLCKDSNGVQLIVEMQVAPTKGFEKRAQYYASKAYSRQLNKGAESDGKYRNLKEVVFIAIADCIIFPHKESYKSDHIVLDKDTYEHDLKDFYFTFIELPKFKKNNIDDLTNMVEKWSFFFKYADETSEKDLQKLIGSDLVIQRAYDELNQFNWTEPELLAYEQEIKRIRDNLEVLEYQLDHARKEGFEQVIEKIAINMLKQNVDISFILSVTGLSEDKVIKLKSKLLAT